MGIVKLVIVNGNSIQVIIRCIVLHGAIEVASSVKKNKFITIICFNVSQTNEKLKSAKKRRQSKAEK